MKAKNLSSVNRKPIGVPKTSQEKYDKLKTKNPAIERLREVFSLNIEL